MAFDSTQSQGLTSNQDTQRAAAAKRLKSAQRSMIVSVVISVLLLVATVAAFISGHYSNPDNRGQTTAIGGFFAIIVIRFGIRGYRLYSKWRNLKDAQEAHRSFQ